MSEECDDLLVETARDFPLINLICTNYIYLELTYSCKKGQTSRFSMEVEDRWEQSRDNTSQKDTAIYLYIVDESQYLSLTLIIVKSFA